MKKSTRKAHEANAGLILRSYLKANPPKFSCTFELKDTRGAMSLRFDEVKEEQIDWANAITNGDGVLMRQVGGNGEPDYTYHYKEPTFIVIKFPKDMEFISIDQWLAERERSKRKSLTLQRARQISTISVKL